MPFEAKLTQDQKESIFDEYYGERKLTQKELAEKYDVSDTTIGRIVNNRKQLIKYNKVLECRKQKAMMNTNLALIAAMEAAPEAISQVIRIAKQSVEDTPLQYQYVIQNACAEVLNRAGVKPEAKDDNEVRVVLESSVGFALGMPDDGE